MTQQLFVKVLIGLSAVAIFYGVAITIILLTLDSPSDAVITRMISGFGAIFSGLLGFSTGYLAGIRNNGGK